MTAEKPVPKSRLANFLGRTQTIVEKATALAIDLRRTGFVEEARAVEDAAFRIASVSPPLQTLFEVQP